MSKKKKRLAFEARCFRAKQSLAPTHTFKVAAKLMAKYRKKDGQKKRKKV